MSQTKIEISNLSDSVISALAVPKITSITYPGDDTAANPTGGQEIILSGSGFSTGAIVNIAGVPVAVSSVVNGNTIAFTSPAKATGSYALSVINTDGGIAVSVTNIEYSGVPAWSTPAGTLGTLYETDSINAQLTAVSDSAVTYTVTSGSLPAGTSLNSATGALTGSTSTVVSSTTYSFTVDAVDAEQQNTSRNFSATINPDAVTWNSPADGVTYTSTEGNVFTQALSATSAAGKTISYSANTLPSGLSITGSTLSGTFSAATTSASLITATATATGKTATRTLNWSIASLVSPSKLWSWGKNSDGQLGLGDTIARSAPVQIGTLTNWLTMSAGYSQSSAIKTDGTLWTWGSNTDGALGLGNTTGYSSPKQVGGLANWSKVSSNWARISAAIKTDGTLWTWGLGGLGSLGDGTSISRSSPVQVGSLTGWLSVSASYGTILAIKTNGTLWAWGANDYGRHGLNDVNIMRSSPTQVGSLTNWKSATVGATHSVAVKTDGTLWSWGRNYYGSLGLNDTTYRYSPVQIGLLTNWSSAVVGRSHTIAIKTNGTLWAFGRDDFSGALGLGVNISRSSPVQVGALTTWLSVAAGQYTSFALRTNGTLWSWGYQQHGSLGLGNTTHYSSPKQIGSSTTWSSVSATNQYVLATSS